MKSVFLFILASVTMLSVSAQDDKSKRPSPPARATQTLETGTVVTIDYSQPAVKGRAIGKDIEPMEGKVWRTGANEATVFEVSKAVEIDNKTLPAGKYGLFTIKEGDTWTFIFNKTWKQWGAYNYNAADDVLRIKAKAEKANDFAERMSLSIDKDGKVALLWGDSKVGFKVK
ncbi:MAG: DUF2911 domain-containing protein [Chitinophagaceae bacterium]|nr:DUF2911 domain-containing protein [Chitinophagaceae bacterium]